MSQKLSLRCRRCRSVFQVDERFAGRRVSCANPDCNAAYRIPDQPPQRPSGRGADSASERGNPPESSPPDDFERSERTQAGAIFGWKRSAIAAAGCLVACSLIALGQNATDVASDDGTSASLKGGVDQTETTPVAVRDDRFEKIVIPFVNQYCSDCHGADEPMAGIAFHEVRSEDSLLANRKTWERVYRILNAGAMPPVDHDPRPTSEQNEAVVELLDEKLFRFDCQLVHDPGRPTIRRLNRAEYNNTIRDLVGIDFHPAADFPSDDVGYGFDNIGDVLSLPPLLMEKYLNAAEQIANAVIIEDSIPKQVLTALTGNQLQSRPQVPMDGGGYHRMNSTAEVFGEFHAPESGEYVLVCDAMAEQAGPDPARIEFRINGEAFETVDTQGQQPREYSVALQLEKGQYRISAAFINDYYQPRAKDRSLRGDRNLAVRELRLTKPMSPELHDRIVCVHPDEDLTLHDAARTVVQRFAERAWRRPLDDDEINRIAALVETTVNDRGESFERGVHLAIQAILVSPHFLFRSEGDPDPDDSGHDHPVNSWELASRLSYFLWSSMPDYELFQLAKTGEMTRPHVLRQEAGRMLKDDKAQALVQNFAAQWLNLRNLDEMNMDSERFPSFTDDLRHAMQRETEMLFETVLSEDRSVIDFLDADFTFVNGPLAQHYGFEGIEGPEMQRVSLEGTNRAGVLTHGSVLTITSNPTRTSPVKRGKWILENILGTPPPPPPADVPDLEETKKASPDASLREQLALHRENAGCASCHTTMDALGFGFENFNAVGQWRDTDGESIIDASAELPTGETFNGPIELIGVLAQRDEAFCRCFTEKLLTFALGRGLEYYDRCAVDEIVEYAKQNDYRMSAIIAGIVTSDPFLNRRGESPSSDE